MVDGKGKLVIWRCYLIGVRGGFFEPPRTPRTQRKRRSDGSLLGDEE